MVNLRLYCIEHKRFVGELDPLLAHKDHSLIRFGAILQKHPRSRFTFKRVTTGPLPSSVDMRPLFVNSKYIPYDQGQQGSCTANCGAEDRLLMELLRGNSPVAFSRAFIYAQERLDINTCPQDSGANMVDIGNVFINYGVCFDSTMPYSDSNLSCNITQAAYTEALNWKCGSQSAIDPSNIKAAIYEASIGTTMGGVRIGVPVGQSFMDCATNGGWVPVPPDNDSLLGGHALLVVGYDDNMKGPDGNVGYFIVLNSWGNIGAGGFIFIPYAFFTSNWVVSQSGTDNWQQTNQNVPPPPPPPPSGFHNVTIAVKQGSGSICSSDPTAPPANCTSTSTVVSVRDGTVITFSSTPASGYTFQKYDGVGTSQSQTFNFTVTADCAVGVYFLASSPCPIGNGISSGMNFILRRMDRRGRFFYLRVR